MTGPGALDDRVVADLIDRERRRRAESLQMIASETPPSEAVREVMASGLAAKYAEGYPGARYHGGCEVVDEIEDLAITRAADLFSADYVNVQPLSGSAANLAVIAAFAQPGDPILALTLRHGGHQTHGSRANFSGRWFQPISYAVTESDERLDYDQIRDLALVHRPSILVVGSSSYSRHVDHAALRAIADEAESILWVDAAHTAGLVAGGAAPSPVPYADVVTLSTHKVLRGPRGGAILAAERHRAVLQKAVSPFVQGAAGMDSIAAKAVGFAEAAGEEYADYTATTVASARALSDALQERGLRIVSGGTDVHLAVVDVSSLGISGVEAQRRLAAAGLVTDKAVLPFDTRPVAEGSAFRIGTSSIVVAGLSVAHMTTVAEWMVDALSGSVDDSTAGGRHARIRAEITELLAG